MLNIDLLAYSNLLRYKTQQQKRYIWDEIRQKYLVVQPEELVRQLFVTYLQHDRQTPANRISIEKMLTVHDLQKRYDVLVFDAEWQPALLVECKAAHIPLDQAVFDQIATYNIPLRVPYLVVTNGIATYCAQLDFERQTYVFLSEIPMYKSLILKG